MSTEPSPRPWRVDGVDISDANGDLVTPLYFNEQDEANVRLIVAAVNERESLIADMKVKETEMLLKVDAAEKERTEACIMRVRAKEWHAVWLKENEKLRDELNASEAERDRLRKEVGRLRKEVGRLRFAVNLLEAAAGPYCAPELRPRLLAEARAELAEQADAEAAEGGAS